MVLPNLVGRTPVLQLLLLLIVEEITHKLLHAMFLRLQSNGENGEELSTKTMSHIWC
jgi:hypothetical protein